MKKIIGVLFSLLVVAGVIVYYILVPKVEQRLSQRLNRPMGATMLNVEDVEIQVLRSRIQLSNVTLTRKGAFFFSNSKFNQLTIEFGFIELIQYAVSPVEALKKAETLPKLTFEGAHFEGLGTVANGEIHYLGTFRTLQQLPVSASQYVADFKVRCKMGNLQFSPESSFYSTWKQITGKDQSAVESVTFTLGFNRSYQTLSLKDLSIQSNKLSITGNLSTVIDIRHPLPGDLSHLNVALNMRRSGKSAWKFEKLPSFITGNFMATMELAYLEGKITKGAIDMSASSIRVIDPSTKLPALSVLQFIPNQKGVDSLRITSMETRTSITNNVLKIDEGTLSTDQFSVRFEGDLGLKLSRLSQSTIRNGKATLSFLDDTTIDMVKRLEKMFNKSFLTKDNTVEVSLGGTLLNPTTSLTF